MGQEKNIQVESCKSTMNMQGSREENNHDSIRNELVILESIQEEGTEMETKVETVHSYSESEKEIEIAKRKNLTSSKVQLGKVSGLPRVR